jgi:hypothetical protein
MSDTGATLLPTPELQFIDADGVPYAGGTFGLYVPGTTTPKDSWMDSQGTVLNTNPIVLDSAGRCIVWGDGLYRCILEDAAGNLIFDQLSTTVVSAAMVPVVAAPTIAEAVRLLGIQPLIDIETSRAFAAEANLQNEINGLASAGSVAAETTRAEAAEANLQNELNAEIARAEAEEANLQNQINTNAGAIASSATRVGTVTTSGGGFMTVVYASPFPHATDQVFCQLVTTFGSQVGWVVPSNLTATGFDMLIYQIPTGSSLTGVSITPVDGTFNYLAYGH